MAETPLVAYFSMEIGLESSMPTYSGGLGVLAGDTIRSAADLEVPMVAVTLLHRHGYFYQRLDAHGNQSEEPVIWSIDDFLEPCCRASMSKSKGARYRYAPGAISSAAPLASTYPCICSTRTCRTMRRQTAR